MLTVETIGRIRREHFIKGKTIREISRDLKVFRGLSRLGHSEEAQDTHQERSVPSSTVAFRARDLLVRHQMNASICTRPIKHDDLSVCCLLVTIDCALHP